MNKKRCNFVPLRIQKINSESGTRISGAVFALIDSKGCVCNGISDSYGSIIFYILPCSLYKLIEITPPAGYAPVNHIYTIFADLCGGIFVDGVHISQFIIRNTPLIVVSNESRFDIFTENLTTGLNNAQPGDMISYDVCVSNDSAAYVNFFLSKAVTLQVDSLMINNQSVTSDRYGYNAVTNTLTIFLRDIVGSGGLNISYSVKVNSVIADINEIIADIVLG